jgi:hypothetical protein
MPYWKELKYHNENEVDGPADVSLPATMHHMQAKAELDLLVEKGALTTDEADAAMTNWRAMKQMGDDDRVVAAIDILEREGLLEEAEAKSLREKAC